MVSLRVIFLVGLLAVSAFAVEVKDMLGRNVKVADTSKIVFIGPGALRLGVYLGLEKDIVGVEAIEKKSPNTAPYREKINNEGVLKNIPIIGQGGPGKIPSPEALIQSGATLLVTSFLNKADVNRLEAQTKIPTFAISYGEGYGGQEQKLEAVRNSILGLGKLTNKEQKAEKISEFMLSQIKELKQLNVKSDSIYVGGMGYKGAQGITSTEVEYPPFVLLGIQNIIQDKSSSGHLFVSLESIIQANPKIVILDSLGKEIVEKEMEAKLPLFQMLDAYQEDNIHWVRPYNFYNTNIENTFIIAWEIAKILGAEIEVKAKEEEILKQFLSN
ncbi:MAG: ABC transporter substrate-binding protein [Campylobacteraceae bacterium]|nr:ABC transporter substrate-binding protein [Campylobacteraceae bacterium]